MSKPKLCAGCGHQIGHHSHIVPHPCKEERCGCADFVRTSHSAATETSPHGAGRPRDAVIERGE